MAKQPKAQPQPSSSVVITLTSPKDAGPAPGTPWSLVADPKTFKSGKTGWWGQARWVLDGAKYMVQLQAVKIDNGD